VSKIEIDTESNPVTKQPLTIQVNMDGYEPVIFRAPYTDDDYWTIKSYWEHAEGILFHNALYDMGVMAICFPQNRFRWKDSYEKKGDYWVNVGGSWEFILFGNKYKARKINGHRNFIQNLNRVTTDKFGDPVLVRRKKKRVYQSIPKCKSTPIIDTLKLWSILIEDPDMVYDKGWSLGLKGTKEKPGLIPRWLKKKAIFYDEDNLSDEYLKQDVVELSNIWKVFLKECPPEVKDFTYQEFADIKSPATLAKIMYEKSYPDLKLYNKHNLDVLEEIPGLDYGLEKGYRGGITISRYRGPVENITWADISGAYANTIKLIDTDEWLEYEVEEIKEYVDESNTLYKVKTNMHFDLYEGSLKIYKTKLLCNSWMWADDIETARMMYGDGFKIKFLKCYKFNPNVESKNVVSDWLKKKKKYKGKDPTRYLFYKNLSNTSYGIKAQRKPRRTKHTNMVIAGVITARVHRVLETINDIIRGMGKYVYYNDTDSAACDELTEEEFKFINSELSRIFKVPYTVVNEGTFKYNDFRSLKRYGSWAGKYFDGSKVDNKVKVHGRGRYDVTRKEVLYYFKHWKVKEDRIVNCIQIGANTGRTMGYLVQAHPEIKFPHPFMFVDREPGIVSWGHLPVKVRGRNLKKKMKFKMLSEFCKEWYDHIDTKTSFSGKSKYSQHTFKRDIKTFKSTMHARDWYCRFIKHDKSGVDGEGKRNWDYELSEDHQILYKDDEWQAIIDWKMEQMKHDMVYKGIVTYKDYNSKKYRKKKIIDDMYGGDPYLWDDTLEEGENAFDTLIQNIMHGRD